MTGARSVFSFVVRFVGCRGGPRFGVPEDIRLRPAGIPVCWEWDTYFMLLTYTIFPSFSIQTWNYAGLPPAEFIIKYPHLVLVGDESVCSRTYTGSAYIRFTLQISGCMHNKIDAPPLTVWFELAVLEKVGAPADEQPHVFRWGARH